VVRKRVRGGHEGFNYAVLKARKAGLSPTRPCRRSSRPSRLTDSLRASLQSLDSLSEVASPDDSDDAPLPHGALAAVVQAVCKVPTYGAFVDPFPQFSIPHSFFLLYAIEFFP
jgi:hypothetical protein